MEVLFNNINSNILIWYYRVKQKKEGDYNDQI